MTLGYSRTKVEFRQSIYPLAQNIGISQLSSVETVASGYLRIISGTLSLKNNL